LTTATGPTLPERIGRYRVIARIGKGAMGSVYSALDEQLGREVAVKLMLAEFEEDPELRERFFREARITGQLAHRNIVTVFDLGEEAGRPYIVMELLDGLSLNEYLRSDTPISLDAKLDLMIQICDGLQNAHQAGVVHRDLKPSNLLVVRDGTVKVLDFGVARLAASNLTAAGMLLGTPEYMSPEQARGQKMDARADLFSAAGVFYYILAGRPPFGSRDLRKVLQAIIAEPPPPLTDDQAPEGLRQVLARALAKSPDDRYQQCIDMRLDLDQIRRSLIASNSRVIQAALDRYQQILSVIEQRRTVGRSLSIADIDASCDAALAAVSTRFKPFADPAGPPPSIDKAAASAALEALQQRHNAEQAALAALHDRVADSMRPASPEPTRTRGSFWRGLLKTRG
jgi:eukaryotic-like serine/threonine-protein kinase